MKIALVYDRVNKWGGAERILLALHNIFPDAPLYTSVYDEKKAPWARTFDIRVSPLQKIYPARRFHEVFAPAMPIAFESFSFDEYDTVISLTSEAAKGIITKPGTRHICICLTPTRYLWSGYDEYFENKFLRSISKPVVSYLQLWDKLAANRPDAYIAISKTVQERIKKYYDRDSKIIYPPLSINAEFSKRKKTSDPSSKQGKNGYFLVVSRLSMLTAYKRVDLAIKAASKLNLPLKIVGEGRDSEYFKQISGPTIEFLGKVSDDKLRQSYENCTALVFPGNEDFGLVMAEALSFGKPVIAYRGGGATEIVKNNKTGVFFDKQTVASLTTVLEKFNPKRYNSQDCVKSAMRFSFQRFKKELMEFF